MSPRISGTSSRTSRPRHLDSPWQRLLLALFNSTTSTAVSMLVTGTHTKTLPQCLILSSRNTTEFLQVPNTHLTWTSIRFKETSLKVPQFTLPESVLVALLMDLDFLPESPRSSVLELRS